MTTRDLNQNVLFFKVTHEPNGYGGTIPTETEYWNTRAKVKHINSGKEDESGEVSFKQGFEFTVRYRQDKSLNVGDHAKYQGKIATIYSLIPDDTFKDFLRVGAWLTL